MAQDSLKTKPVTSAAPIKTKKEHKFADALKNSMGNAAVSLAAAGVMTTGGMIINRAQNDASKR